MSVFEKIWYTWVILIVPLSLFVVFFDEDKNKHPIIWNVICAFIWLPIVILLVSALIYGIVQVWN